MASLDAHLVAWQARDVVPCRAKIVCAGRAPVEANVIVVAGAGGGHIAGAYMKLRTLKKAIYGKTQKWCAVYPVHEGEDDVALAAGLKLAGEDDGGGDALPVFEQRSEQDSVCIKRLVRSHVEDKVVPSEDPIAEITALVDVNAALDAADATAAAAGRAVPSRHVVRLFGVLHDPKYIYVVMELLRGGEMYDVVDERMRKGKGPIPADVVRVWGPQVAGALAAVHANGRVFHDFSMENLVLRHPIVGGDKDLALCEPVLIDFGMTFPTAAPPARAGCPFIMGKPFWKAPEQFQRGAYPVPCAVDIWSLGVCVLTWLTGHVLFDTPSLAKAIEKHGDNATARDQAHIASGSIFHYLYSNGPAGHPFGARRVRELYAEWSEAHLVPNDAADFVAKCLALDPGARMTAAECLAHPFLAPAAAPAVVAAAAVPAFAPSVAPAGPAAATDADGDARMGEVVV